MATVVAERPARISIVVPVLNEAERIAETLKKLAPARQRGHEVLVVDGGSSDDTLACAEPYCDRIVTSSAGRARQMNHGAKLASGDILWFLHADTHLPADADILLCKLFAKEPNSWGRFDVQLSGTGVLLRMVAFMMNWRSRWSGIATGDQGIFVPRPLFEQLGGFADIPLMEDIEFSKRLKRISRPVCLHERLTTSSRRWESRGVMHTILLMWRLRLFYALGASPDRLARLYK